MGLRKTQIALTNYPYHKCSLDFTLHSMEKLGIKTIEFVCCEPHFYFEDVTEADTKELMKKLEEKGFTIICLTAPTMEYPMNLASENIMTRTKTVKYLVDAIQYAEKLHAPIVSFNMGQAPLDADTEAAWTRAKEAVAYLVSVAESFGVRIALYVTGSRKSSLLDSVEKAKRLKKEIPSGSLGFVADTVYLDKMALEPETFIRELGLENIFLVNFADCKSGALHLAPGEGNLDLEKCLKSFERAGYEGYVSLNMRGSRDPYVYEEQPERCMKNGLEWLLAHLSDGC